MKLIRMLPVAACVLVLGAAGAFAAAAGDTGMAADEYRDVLRAFKYGDPNGNGEADDTRCT